MDDIFLLSNKKIHKKLNGKPGRCAWNRESLLLVLYRILFLDVKN